MVVISVTRQSRYKGEHGISSIYCPGKQNANGERTVTATKCIDLGQFKNPWMQGRRGRKRETKKRDRAGKIRRRKVFIKGVMGVTLNRVH